LLIISKLKNKNTRKEKRVFFTKKHFLLRFLGVFLFIGGSLFFLQKTVLYASPQNTSVPFFESKSTFPHTQTIPLVKEISHLSMGSGGNTMKIVEGVALASVGSVYHDVQKNTLKNGGEIALYIVEEGDSLSQIAELFSVSVNTIVWANELKNNADIHPGKQLLILPVSGVQHTVEKGDTLSSLAKKYGGNEEEIMLFNRLSEKDLIKGSVITVPGGEHPKAKKEEVSPVKNTSFAQKSETVKGGYFIHPLPGSTKTQGPHGYQGNSLDFSKGVIGSPVRASAGGTVLVSKVGGWNGGYGNYVVLNHPNGTQTLYAHLHTNSVSVGEYVGQGDTVGTVGNTGRSTGPHLHFEVRGARNPF
jgi:LysM repeat protein